MHFKIRLLEKMNRNIVDKVENYFQIPQKTFIDMYLPSEHTYEFVKENEPANICILGIQHTDNHLLRDNEINILFCVENLYANRSHYKQYNQYKDFNNDKIHIYLYNHFSKPIVAPSYKMYPQIYFRINYFKQISHLYEKYRVPFHQKRFCLFTSQNMLNKNTFFL